MAERGPLSSTWLMLRKRPRLLTLSGLGLLAIIVAVHLQISGPSLAQGFDNLLVILAEAWPPDFSVLTKRASWANPPCSASRQKRARHAPCMVSSRVSSSVRWGQSPPATKSSWCRRCGV